MKGNALKKFEGMSNYPESRPNPNPDRGSSSSKLHKLRNQHWLIRPKSDRSDPEVQDSTTPSLGSGLDREDDPGSHKSVNSDQSRNFVGSLDLSDHSQEIHYLEDSDAQK